YELYLGILEGEFAAFGVDESKLLLKDKNREIISKPEGWPARFLMWVQGKTPVEDGSPSKSVQSLDPNTNALIAKKNISDVYAELKAWRMVGAIYSFNKEDLKLEDIKKAAEV